MTDRHTDLQTDSPCHREVVLPISKERICMQICKLKFKPHPIRVGRFLQGEYERQHQSRDLCIFKVVVAPGIKIYSNFLRDIWLGAEFFVIFIIDLFKSEKGRRNKLQSKVYNA